MHHQPNRHRSDKRSVRRLKGSGKVRYRVLSTGVNSEPSPHALASAPRWELATEDGETLADVEGLVLMVDELVHQMSRLLPGRVWRIRATRFEPGKLRVKLEATGPSRAHAAAEGYAPFEVLLREAATKVLARAASPGAPTPDGRLP